MQVIRLASETDLTGWRAAARSLRSLGVAPEEALWTVDGAGGDLFAATATGGEAPMPPQAQQGGAPFTVPREFVELADLVVLHRSDERFALLYRMLWRLAREPQLLHIHSDPDVQKARHLAADVSRAAHKMKAFVRFRQVAEGDQTERYVAWFEPAHRVTEMVAPFFVARFATMDFSILTPDACLHWDTKALVVLPGADPADAPTNLQGGEDALEDYWRAYYASIFNPARLKTASMQQHMPKRYWRNLPEARLIPDLIARAETRTAAMVRQPSSIPDRVIRQVTRKLRDGTFDDQQPANLEEVAAMIQACRRCDLWRDATQGVAGEGPSRAKLMLVGEQPGDQEDLAGKPFVGPAGQMLDRALAEAGVPRDQTYVTNAVKHFKHEPRGKRRLHKTPNTGEVTACRWWLDHERRLVKPRVVVALGATAVTSVFGKALPIAGARQTAHQLPDQSQGVVTYHPSYLLRVPDAEAKAKAYAMFVEDLRFAWRLVA
ncbi:MAG: UdgX family uracil-DNA binding protein [Proteobacteria bacterium]|nr:UdgX family uracil-DNA binding protein [Pseudomonadota bacterium]